MREAKIKRKTGEVDITGEFVLDGQGEYTISTGIEFLDHMLSLFIKHGLFNLKLCVKGDLGVDIHHTNEDTAIALGEAFCRALGTKERIKRFAVSFVCMDEALVRCVVDLSGRPYLKLNPVTCRFEKATYTYSHFKQFLKAFVDHSRINLHLDILENEDLHHALEASFKALALALRDASAIDPLKKGLPTTKGKID